MRSRGWNREKVVWLQKFSKWMPGRLLHFFGAHHLLQDWTGAAAERRTVSSCGESQLLTLLNTRWSIAAAKWASETLWLYWEGGGVWWGVNATMSRLPAHPLFPLFKPLCSLCYSKCPIFNSRVTEETHYQHGSSCFAVRGWNLSLSWGENLATRSAEWMLAMLKLKQHYFYLTVKCLCYLFLLYVVRGSYTASHTCVLQHTSI